MTVPRRKVLRSAVAPSAKERRDALLREKLAKERAALKRWQKKLKLSFTKIQRISSKIIRIERKLAG